MKIIDRIPICKIISIFLMFFFVFLSLATAEDKEAHNLKLDVSKSIAMAFEASEDLKISENDVKRQESKRKEERSCALPQIAGEVGWFSNVEYPDATAASVTKDYHAGVGVSVSQTIFTFGRISSAISAAEKTVKGSQFNKLEMEQEIIYNTKIAYYRAYLAEKIFEIAQESCMNAKQNKKILEERSAQGRASKYDNIKISSDISSRIPVANNASADFVSSLETLKVVIGVEEEVKIELVEGFALEYPALNREILAKALRDNQPAIKALDMIIKEKEDLVRSKRAALFPDISIYATWNHKGDGNDYYIKDDNMDDYGVVGVKVDVPVWLGGLNKELLAQARIDKKDAELQYKKGQKDYLLVLDKATNAYREYKKTLAANNEAIRWAEESFKYCQELFGSGQVSVTDLNDAELQLTNAKISKEKTLFNLNIILAQVERLTLIGNKNE